MKGFMRLLLLFVFLISSSVWAQGAKRLEVAPKSLNEEPETSQKTVHLSDLVKKGLSYSPDVRKAEADYKISKEEFNQAEATIFPTLNLEASATNRKQALISFGQSGFNRQNLYQANLVLSQPLYVGGAITSGLTAAKLGKELARQKLFSQKQKYLDELISAYYDYSERVESLRQAVINRDFLKNYTKIARQYASIGRTKSIDRLQAEANLASSESSVLEQESEVETSENKLLQIIGEENFESAKEKIITQLSIQPIEPLALEEALKKALENNPEFKEAELELQRQEHLNDLSLVEDRPRLTLDGSYGYVTQTRDEWFQDDRNSYSVGVNLVIPIFSGFSSLAKRRANAQVKLQKEQDLVLKQEDLKQTLSTAIETLQRDFKRIKHLKSAVELGRKAMDSALRDYRRGLVSSTDVVAIQNNRFQSELELLRVSSSYMKQVLSLRRDLGVELEKIYGM